MTLIYHESYGEVTRKQLATYRKHNISPSDHMFLEDAFGDDRKSMVEEVLRQTRNGQMFSFLHIGKDR